MKRERLLEGEPGQEKEAKILPREPAIRMVDLRDVTDF